MCHDKLRFIELMLDYLLRVNERMMFINVWLMCAHDIEIETDMPSWEVGEKLQAYLVSDTVTVDDVLKSVYRHAEFCRA